MFAIKIKHNFTLNNIVHSQNKLCMPQTDIENLDENCRKRMQA